MSAGGHRPASELRNRSEIPEWRLELSRRLQEIKLRREAAGELPSAIGPDDVPLPAAGEKPLLEEQKPASPKLTGQRRRHTTRVAESGLQSEALTDGVTAQAPASATQLEESRASEDTSVLLPAEDILLRPWKSAAASRDQDDIQALIDSVIAQQASLERTAPPAIDIEVRPPEIAASMPELDGPLPELPPAAAASEPATTAPRTETAASPTKVVAAGTETAMPALETAAPQAKTAATPTETAALPAEIVAAVMETATPAPETATPASEIAAQQTETAAPPTETATTPPQAAPPEPRIFAPPPEAAAPAPRFSAPPPKIAMAPPQAAPPSPRIFAPPTEAIAPSPRITAPPRETTVTAPKVAAPAAELSASVPQTAIFSQYSGIPQENKLILLSRTLAGLVDLIIVIVSGSAFIFTVDVLEGIDVFDAVSITHYLLLLLVTYFVYSLFFLSTGTQTIGMMLTDLRVVGTSMKRPKITQLLVRCITFLLGLAAFGVGLLWGCFDRQSRCLHDWLSQTRVERISS